MKKTVRENKLYEKIVIINLNIGISFYITFHFNYYSLINYRKIMSTFLNYALFYTLNLVSHCSCFLLVMYAVQWDLHFYHHHLIIIIMINYNFYNQYSMSLFLEANLYLTGHKKISN